MSSATPSTSCGSRGEIEEKTPASEGKDYARKGGLKGGKARAASMTKERRAEIAKKAAALPLPALLREITKNTALDARM
jgi:hypothetical protein